VRRESSTVVVLVGEADGELLAGLAAAWQAMWDVTAGPGGQAGAAGFEGHAAQALAAWREKRFELPDYYLVAAPSQGEGTGPDFYLGPLRAARPSRVAVAGATGGSQARRASRVGRCRTPSGRCRTAPGGRRSMS
jgi:hypothetical protein